MLTEKGQNRDSSFPSESVNFTEQPLTADEQQLIAAFRVNDKQRVWAMAFDKVVSNRPESDVADQLAMFICGSLALRYSEFADMFKSDDRERLHLFWEDVAAAIREGLPRLDIREFENIHAGK